MSDIPGSIDMLNERAEKLFNKFLPLKNAMIDIPQNAMIDIPQFEKPLKIQCEKCNGTGKMIECPECCGKGELHFDTEYNDYNITCKTCDGKKVSDKYIIECEHCDNGYNVKMARINIGCAAFSNKYLAMICDFPDIKISIIGKSDPMYFTFAGGEGLLSSLCKED